jgi:hypothetical protein
MRPTRAANTASSRANTATNNFRVRSHPRRRHPAQVKSKNDANEQLARLEDARQVSCRKLESFGADIA